MRGAVSDAGPVPVGAAYRTSRPVPAFFHEDPLFLELCAAFDEMLGPFVLALDCFSAYLDPWLAPADFLGWLGGLVGAQQGPEPELAWRAHVAGAVRGYRARGTVQGLRAAAAAAAGVPDKQVSLTETGAVTWADTPGTAVSPAFDPTVVITVKVPPGSDVAAVTARVQDAAAPGLPVFSQLRIKVEES
jgi:phage tail-like protein